MTRRLKVDQALKALPEVDDLLPFREALIGASREDGSRAWAASEAYATLDTRLADPAALDAQVAALAERARERVERGMRQAVAALRAMEALDWAAAARALVAAGEAEEAAGRPETAEGWYRKALELGRKPRDRAAEGLALRRLGRAARARGHLERAARMYRQAFEVAAAQRDADGAVVACQGLGNVHVDQGLWAEARAWYLRGLELLPPGAPPVLRWQLFVNLAVVERRDGLADAAAQWLDRAAAVVDETGDDAGRMHVEHGRARLHLARGEAAAAEGAARRALALPAEPFSRATALLTLAEALLARGEPGEAERAARQAERVAIGARLVAKLPDVYRALGKVARARRDAEGFLFYEQARELCEEHRLPLIELAAVQHEYGAFEAELGMRESGRARLEEALRLYERLGTGPETRAVRRELEALDAAEAVAEVEG